MIKLDRCVRSCDTLNHFSNKICIQTKTEDLNIRVFNMITEINESKTLAKDISWECKYRVDRTKCNSNHWWNNYKCWCDGKNIMYVKKIMFRILLNVIAKMENI